VRQTQTDSILSGVGDLTGNAFGKEGAGNAQFGLGNLFGIGVSEEHYGAGYVLCIIAWVINWVIAGLEVAVYRAKGSEGASESGPAPPAYTPLVNEC